MMTVAPDIRELNQWLRQQAPAAQLTLDSRRVQRGDVFLACPGESGDGRRYIGQAIESGARAVLFDDAEGFLWNTSWETAHRAVPELARHAGRIAHDYYAQPDLGLFSVAVTGTNGKTSCTQWLGQALSNDRIPTVVIGTLGVGLYRRGSSGAFVTTGFTTPDAVQLHRYLAEHKAQGAAALAIEASSIGLVQGRLDELHIDCAVLTNFTRDHLDFHGTMEAYEEAKAKLFDWRGLRHAVINLDDPMGVRTVTRMRATNPDTQLIGYTLEGRSLPGVQVVSASDIRIGPQGATFQLESPFGAGPVRTQLIGRFNVSNVLAIAGVLFARGLRTSIVIGLLESLVAVPGRMQQLGGPDSPLAVVDYAHTPDALEKAIATLRVVAEARQGELWCVFGCGGDRDPGKRPQMGAAASHADRIIVTSDNPRSEEPADIIAQIVAGLPTSEHGRLQVIEDRATAILSAIRHAGKNDVILIAGKGHEDYQEIKGRRLAFRDADHAALALATRATRYGGH
jgi:UDP-N-acetylmuramoyl-L-alanyl-D-glutamate--2,6-diaminopimelate ligase